MTVSKGESTGRFVLVGLVTGFLRYPRRDPR
jgi:hypothetical protein